MVYRRNFFLPWLIILFQVPNCLKKVQKKDFLSQNCLSSQNLCVEVAKIWCKSLGQRFQAKASAADAEAEG